MQEIVKLSLLCLWLQISQNLSCYSWSSQGPSSPMPPAPQEDVARDLEDGSLRSIKLHEHHKMPEQQTACTEENNCKTLGSLGSLRAASNQPTRPHVAT